MPNIFWGFCIVFCHSQNLNAAEDTLANLRTCLHVTTTLTFASLFPPSFSLRRKIPTNIFLCGKSLFDLLQETFSPWLQLTKNSVCFALQRSRNAHNPGKCENPPWEWSDKKTQVASGTGKNWLCEENAGFLHYHSPLQLTILGTLRENSLRMTRLLIDPSS